MKLPGKQRQNNYHRFNKRMDPAWLCPNCKIREWL